MELSSMPEASVIHRPRGGEKPLLTAAVRQIKSLPARHFSANSISFAATTLPSRDAFTRYFPGRLK
jgi:hypothetical protein